VARAGPYRAGIRRRVRFGASRVKTCSPGSGGREVLRIAAEGCGPQGSRVEEVSALARGWVPGSEAWKEKALEGQKPRRGSTAGLGKLRTVRTDSQGEESFEVDEAAERGGSAAPGPGRPGSVLARGKGTQPPGDQANTCERGLSGETGGFKAWGGALRDVRG
jgi:hypothetical protein